MSIINFKSSSIGGEDKTSGITGLNYISLKPVEKSKQISLSSKNSIGYRTVQPYPAPSTNHFLFRTSDGRVRCSMIVGGSGNFNFALPFTSSSTPDASGSIGYGHGGGTAFGHDPPHFDAHNSGGGPSIGGSSNNGSFSLTSRSYPGWMGNSFGGGTGWVTYRVSDSIS